MGRIGARPAASFQEAPRWEALQEGIEEDVLCLPGHQAFAKLGEHGIMEARLLGTLPKRSWLKRLRRLGLEVLIPLWRHAAHASAATRSRWQWTLGRR